MQRINVQFLPGTATYEMQLYNSGTPSGDECIHKHSLTRRGEGACFPEMSFKLGALRSLLRLCSGQITLESLLQSYQYLLQLVKSLETIIETKLPETNVSQERFFQTLD